MSQAAQLRDKLRNLRRRSNANRIRDAQPIDYSQLADDQVDAQQIGFVAAKRVLGAEAQDDVRRLLTDEAQRLARHVDDLVNGLAMAVLAQRWRRADHHVQAADASIQGTERIVFVAADVR